MWGAEAASIRLVLSGEMILRTLRRRFDRPFNLIAVTHPKRGRSPARVASPAGLPPLTTRAVADRCGVDVKTVHIWASRGLLPHFRTPGGHLRFLDGDVAALAIGARTAPVSPGRVVWITSERRGIPSKGVLRVGELLEGICRAALEGARAVVIDARAARGLDAKRIARAVRRCLPRCSLVWIGAEAPRGVRGVQRVATRAEALTWLENTR
jgi:hypothetical protein